MQLLEEAGRNFLARANGGQRERFARFKQGQAEWLEDFVLFLLLRRRFGGQQWNAWPRELAQRDSAALSRVRAEAAEELELERVVQFFFFEQWEALRGACHARGIQIVGDVAIFVSYDSADVWTHREIFWLRQDGQPEFVAGVPPDAFSATGQRWGNPLYRWDVLKSRGYDWWIARTRAALHTCDIVRLDHFRGFESYWEIPASQPTAEHGRWAPGPGDDLFHALRGALGELPFIAEDLGFITPEVHALRDRLQIPGMRVMQFGFGDAGAHMYLPHRFHSNVVVYTGTHDNDTTEGWWKKWATENERAAASEYLGLNGGQSVAWSMIRAAEESVADLCILPLQDVLELGSEARMNIPSKADGNWSWRVLRDQLKPEVAKRMARLTELTDRFNPKISVSSQQSDRKVTEDFAA
jgi:4-alpha-glucanotransferase